MTTGNMRPSRSGPLRSSCDICHTMKTKCVRAVDAAACARCTKLGKHCNYSHSDKMGRPVGAREQLKKKRSTQSSQSPEPAAFAIPPRFTDAVYQSPSPTATQSALPDFDTYSYGSSWSEYSPSTPSEFDRPAPPPRSNTMPYPTDPTPGELVACRDSLLATIRDASSHASSTATDTSNLLRTFNNIMDIFNQLRSQPAHVRHAVASNLPELYKNAQLAHRTVSHRLRAAILLPQSSYMFTERSNSHQEEMDLYVLDQTFACLQTCIAQWTAPAAIQTQSPHDYSLATPPTSSWDNMPLSTTMTSVGNSPMDCDTLQRESWSRSLAYKPLYS